MNGDLFTALDFRELVAFHESSGATATVATLEREVPIEFGVIGVEGTRIVDYDEKPTIAYDVRGRRFRAGGRVIERRALRFPDVATSCSSEACRSPPTARPTSGSTSVGARTTSWRRSASTELRGELLPTRDSLAMEPWAVPPDVDVSDELAEAVRETVKSGWWSMGPRW